MDSYRPDSPTETRLDRDQIEAEELIIQANSSAETLKDSIERVEESLESLALGSHEEILTHLESSVELLTDKIARHEVDQRIDEYRRTVNRVRAFLESIRFE